MRVREKPPQHLTYCLNVHPGESWEENFQAIETDVLKIRDRVCCGRAFGLGLRLGWTAAKRLCAPKNLEAFKFFLARNNLYVFTINGFPYGSFHGSPVKENVYRPDWRSGARRGYTLKLADILAALLPPGVSGSISTVPGSYKPWVRSDSDRTGMIHNLMRCAAHLSCIRENTGRELHIALEPEPDCFLETTDETTAFFERDLFGEGTRYLARLTGRTAAEAQAMAARHLGVCFDTCHMSLQFENLAESLARFAQKGIRISKIQISAALKTGSPGRAMERLKDFCDSVYLHQVKACRKDGRIVSYGDLPDVLENPDSERIRDGQEWRVHCHLPLYFTGDPELQSTASDLTPEFFKEAAAGGCEHLEIETYTFNVLPQYLKAKGIVGSVSAEYEWVLGRLPF